MTDYSHKIKPGDPVLLSEYTQNFLDLQSSTFDIKDGQIVPGSIDYRHTSGDWKLSATYSDYTTTKDQAQSTATPLHLPTVASTYTTVGAANPVFVFARIGFTSTGNSQSRFGIYVNGSRKTSTSCDVQVDHIQELHLFHMFQAASDTELIELRTETATAQLSYSISHFEMEIFSVRS
jgi:major membrane immunogen (membrane-anchored lipoprotein)